MNDKFTQTNTIAREKHQYAIYDRARKAFLALMEKTNDRVALRDFEKLCEAKECMICQAPEDYALYYIGAFNEELGSFDNQIRKLAEAVDYSPNYTPKPKKEVKKTCQKKAAKKH